MARLMLSEGMFSAFAAATAVRRRGFFSGSPPVLAAIVISLISRVKILPRLASSAPFLCLIVAHFEWPDMGTSIKRRSAGANLFQQRTAKTGNYSRCPCEYITGWFGLSSAPASQPKALTVAKNRYLQAVCSSPRTGMLGARLEAPTTVVHAPAVVIEAAGIVETGGVVERLVIKAGLVVEVRLIG